MGMHCGRARDAWSREGWYDRKLVMRTLGARGEIVVGGVIDNSRGWLLALLLLELELLELELLLANHLKEAVLQFVSILY